MTHHRSVHSLVHAGIAALCWAILQHMERLQAGLSDYKELVVPAILALLALLFRTSDALSNAIIVKIPVLSKALRRLLEGRDFIEGDWPLVVIDIARGELMYLGFLRIGFKGGQPYVHGDDWHPDGTHAHAFHSVQSRFDAHTLQYWYEQGASMHRPDMRGYTEIYFFPRHRLAERHAGKFLDPKHTSDIRFYARRRCYGWLERRLTTKDEKLAAARKLWADLEPRLGHLATRDISADFE